MSRRYVLLTGGPAPAIYTLRRGRPHKVLDLGGVSDIEAALHRWQAAHPGATLLGLALGAPLHCQPDTPPDLRGQTHQRWLIARARQQFGDDGLVAWSSRSDRTKVRQVRLFGVTPDSLGLPPSLHTWCTLLSWATPALLLPAVLRRRGRHEPVLDVELWLAGWLIQARLRDGELQASRTLRIDDPARLAEERERWAAHFARQDGVDHSAPARLYRLSDQPEETSPPSPQAAAERPVQALHHLFITAVLRHPPPVLLATPDQQIRQHGARRDRFFQRTAMFLSTLCLLVALTPWLMSPLPLPDQPTAPTMPLPAPPALPSFLTHTDLHALAERLRRQQAHHHLSPDAAWRLAGQLLSRCPGHRLDSLDWQVEAQTEILTMQLSPTGNASSHRCEPRDLDTITRPAGWQSARAVASGTPSLNGPLTLAWQRPLAP